MLNLWTLGGLSIRELLLRTARASWQDAVFGQGGRMAFYHFLALFPSLLVFLALASLVPDLGDGMRNSVQDLASLVLPTDASHLVAQRANELKERSPSG